MHLLGGQIVFFWPGVPPGSGGWAMHLGVTVTTKGKKEGTLWHMVPGQNTAGYRVQTALANPLGWTGTKCRVERWHDEYSWQCNCKPPCCHTIMTLSPYIVCCIFKLCVQWQCKCVCVSTFEPFVDTKPFTGQYTEPHPNTNLGCWGWCCNSCPLMAAQSLILLDCWAGDNSKANRHPLGCCQHTGLAHILFSNRTP